MDYDFRALDAPAAMNLELTSKCPLRCPQCYCDLIGGRDMPFETARRFVEDAASCGVREVNLSGGETMCYPYLTELIALCHEKGLISNIALSGFGVTKEKLQELIDAGVTRIFISLNGSCEEVNRLSRDGYELAIHALSVLKEISFHPVYMNWVMHRTNADDFPKYVSLVESYGVDRIHVMAFKPDAAHQLNTLPTGEQMKQVADFIRHYKGPVTIDAEGCYSPMRALLYDSFFGNRNVGIVRGCMAGRLTMSVSIDGKMTPCRHLEFEEEFSSIQDYWDHSEILKKLRQVEDEMEEPCSTCRYSRNCLPCMAVNVKLHDELSMGFQECPIAM